MMRRGGGGGGVEMARALAAEYKGGADIIPANATDDEDRVEDNDEDDDKQRRQQGDGRDSDGDGGVSRHWLWWSGRTSPRWPQ
jgi:hypothetical protein